MSENTKCVPKIIAIFYSIHKKSEGQNSPSLYPLLNILNREELEGEPDPLGLPASLFSSFSLFFVLNFSL